LDFAACVHRSSYFFLSLVESRNKK
jgi:hypothetical protein